MPVCTDFKPISGLQTRTSKPGLFEAHSTYNGYSLLEPFTNMLIKRYKPSVFLTGCLFFWGICMTAQGLVSNPDGLYVARFFLGVTEAALFPVSCLS
jgi:hypothetical protein